jgi:hypothetical protein
MTKAIIESVDGADYFILNGIKRPRAYEAIGVNLLADKKGVKLIPAQRDETSIQDTILFDEFLIDGTVPESQDECISLLNQIVFKKGGGNGGGVANSLIIPIGEMLVFKVGSNENNNIQEPGDFCKGIVEGIYIEAIYLGGDTLLLESYNIINQIEL